jgi:hypothetical protein
LIEEAESLGTDLSSTEMGLLARAQEQADHVAALNTQRTGLSAVISTEEADAATELSDLTSEISTFDSTLEGEITSNVMSVETRSDTNGDAIGAMPAAISAVSGSVSTHEAALETAADSLETKIDDALDAAATVNAEFFLCKHVCTTLLAYMLTMGWYRLKARYHRLLASLCSHSLEVLPLATRLPTPLSMEPSQPRLPSTLASSRHKPMLPTRSTPSTPLRPW